MVRKTFNKIKKYRKPKITKRIFFSNFRKNTDAFLEENLLAAAHWLDGY